MSYDASGKASSNQQVRSRSAGWRRERTSSSVVATMSGARHKWRKTWSDARPRAARADPRPPGGRTETGADVWVCVPPEASGDIWGRTRRVRRGAAGTGRAARATPAVGP